MYKLVVWASWPSLALPDRSLDHAFFVDALCRGAKPQRGRRIVLKIDHIIIKAKRKGKTSHREEICIYIFWFEDGT
jgi:hypothetical protein